MQWDYIYINTVDPLTEQFKRGENDIKPIFSPGLLYWGPAGVRGWGGWGEGGGGWGGIIFIAFRDYGLV